MSNSKVKMEVLFDINEEMLQEHGLSAEKVLDNIYMDDDDVRDGFQIGTIIDGFDNTSDFFLENGVVVSKEIVSLERDKDAERYPKLTNTRDGKNIKEALNPQGLSIIEDILDAYAKDRIDIEVVRDENEQIEFDKSGSLIVKDKSYEKTGFESLVIKWYEDMEDTGYLIECFSEYSKDRKFEKAAALVNDLSSTIDGRRIFDIANIVFSLKGSEGDLSQEDILRLTERIYEASFMTDVPLLTAERVDAVCSLLEYGITEYKSPELPSASPEQAKELLLTCDMDVFIDLVETVAIDNQAFYAPEYCTSLEERLQPVKEAILAIKDKRATLDVQLKNAAKKVDNSTLKQERCEQEL